MARLVAGLTAYPAYYAHMGPRNRQGPGPADLSPAETVDADELRTRLKAGEWVVDLRGRTAYAAEHVHGTIGIALGDQFCTYLGWLIPWDTPLTLVGENSRQVVDAQRQLVRIGIDRRQAPRSALPPTWPRPTNCALTPFPRSPTSAPPATVVTNRWCSMCAATTNARAAPSQDPPTSPSTKLLQRLGEVPDGLLWVHCAAGFRASIAASLLARAGHNVVLVDDDYSAAVTTGLATG